MKKLKFSCTLADRKMKTFAIVLLCAFAAVQGRSAGVQVANQRSLAALGENPWVVHLRMSVFNSGLLKSCTGSFIGGTWVLTSADCADNARFIFVRFGSVEVIRPELVLETSATRLHPNWNSINGNNNIAIVNVHRAVENSQNIAAIPLPSADAEPVNSANLCTYGENEDNTPGDALSCADVDVIAVNDVTLIADTSVSTFDTGAALVGRGVLVGLVSRAGDSEGTAVITRTEAYVDWITLHTGVQPGRAGAPEPVIVVDN